MDHFKQEKTFSSNKLGFHYFLDDERFNQKDARLWIQKLKEVNAKWLVVNNPNERAIPEDFIRAFSGSGINLIINFNQQLNSQYDLTNIHPLLHVYGKWGLKFACLFEKPNIISSWGEIEWNNQDIVKTHLKKFVQFAQASVENSIKPIFSPLFPGGDYWDLAFLEESLKGLALYAAPEILNNIVLSAFGWTWGHKIEWGSGGKNKWTNAKPYQTDQDSQDQKGFRAYEWYLEISEKVLGKKLPIFIFEAGFHNIDNFGVTKNPSYPPESFSSIPNLLSGGNIYDPQNQTQLLSPIPNQVLGCALFVLSASVDQKYFPYRWFKSTGEPLELATTFGAEKQYSIEKKINILDENKIIEKVFQFKYRRYIFVADELKNDMPNLLEKLDPYIRKFKPQIGFSKIEAINAAHILAITVNKEKDPLNLEESQSRKSVIKIVTPDEIAAL